MIRSDSSVRRLFAIAGLCLALTLAIGIGPAAAQTMTIDIQVSPATIVISSLGECLTIHTDIALSKVDRSSVTLNGLYPYAVFADARGQLVAKFDLDQVKAIVAPPSATMTLTGTTTDGTPLTGTDTVPVKE